MASQSIIYQEIIQNEFKVLCGSISYLTITLNDYVTGYSKEGTEGIVARNFPAMMNFLLNIGNPDNDLFFPCSRQCYCIMGTRNG